MFWREKNQDYARDELALNEILQICRVAGTETFPYEAKSGCKCLKRHERRNPVNS